LLNLEFIHSREEAGMKRFLSVIAVVVLAAPPLGCNPFAPDQSVVLGVSKLEAPTSVSAGSPITVVLTVTTGGCKTFSRIDLERDASAASLTPWGTDGAKGRKDITCPANIVDTPHAIRLDPPFQNPFMVLVPRVGMEPLTATVQIQ
jgi:hypothetical protein